MTSQRSSWRRARECLAAIPRRTPAIGDVRVGREVAGRRSALLVVAFLVASSALTIIAALLLDADGAGHPATWESVLVAVVIVLGGPQVMAAIRADARGAPAHEQPGVRRADPPSDPALDHVVAGRGRLGGFRVCPRPARPLGLGAPKQLATLEEAGYVAIERPVSERRRRVRARLTPFGRERFQGHVAALQGQMPRRPVSG